MNDRVDREIATSLAAIAALADEAPPPPRGDVQALRAKGTAGQSFMAGLVGPSPDVVSAQFSTTADDGAPIALRWYTKSDSRWIPSRRIALPTGESARGAWCPRAGARPGDRARSAPPRGAGPWPACAAVSAQALGGLVVFVDHDYEIERDADGIAEISKKWFRVRESYGVEIDEGQDVPLLLAITVAIDALASG